MRIMGKALQFKLAGNRWILSIYFQLNFCKCSTIIYVFKASNWCLLSNVTFWWFFIDTNPYIFRIKNQIHLSSRSHPWWIICDLFERANWPSSICFFLLTCESQKRNLFKNYTYPAVKSSTKVFKAFNCIQFSLQVSKRCCCHFTCSKFDDLSTLFITFLRTLER